MRKSGKVKGMAAHLRQQPRIVDYQSVLAYENPDDTRRKRRWTIVLEKHVPGKGKRRWRRSHWGKKPDWYPA